MITIVDYGMGNVGSIHNMLIRLGVEVKIASGREEIMSATKLILPGVGAFDQAMHLLHASGLVDALNLKVLQQRTPILGICLGMQLFTLRSEEGNAQGLGWIDAETIRFRYDDKAKDIRVPHMGWASVSVHRTTDLFRDLPDDPRFYFVHSYHVRCADENLVVATAEHGIKFHAAVARGHIMGTQFHPEKSHKFGLRVLGNFANLPK